MNYKELEYIAKLNKQDPEQYLAEVAVSATEMLACQMEHNGNPLYSILKGDDYSLVVINNSKSEEALEALQEVFNE